MDRERNDCLGRRGRQRQFEHWRQILRRCRESDTHANTFADPNRDSYADADGNCNCDTYGYTHSYSELHAEVSTDAAAAPDTGTSTLEARK